MVEGLTTSAPDPGSGTGRIETEFPTTHEIVDLDFSAPALEPATWLGRTDAADHFQQQDPGDASGEAIPVPIPNTEVKPVSADGTWGAAPWESRTPPELVA